jgi:serine/threonine protein kinase
MALNLVGNYSLGAVIGQGTSAVVHQAWQRETGAFVAIKKFERSSNDIKAVLTELDLLSKLDHPNIVKYLGAINDSEGLHVVLEYMENGSLVCEFRGCHSIQVPC